PGPARRVIGPCHVIQEPTDRELAERVEHACAGARDRNTVRVAVATSALLQAFEYPAGPSREPSFGPDTLAGKVPLPAHRFHQSVGDRGLGGPLRSGPRESHCVAPRQWPSRMEYQPALPPVTRRQSGECRAPLGGW